MSGTQPVSSVSIANRALAAVGTRSTISSLTEGSTEANNVALVYAPVRQQLLRAAPWGWAKATTTLSLWKAQPGTPENTNAATTYWSNANPPPGWNYSYLYPSDAVFVRKVIGNLTAVADLAIPLYPAALSITAPSWDQPGQHFETATDLDAQGNPITVILANQQAAIGCYIRDITVEAIWDPLFTEAFVMALAGKLALSLTGDKALSKLKLEDANRMILEARRAAGNESPTVVDSTPDWIAKGHGARWVPGVDGTGWAQPWGPMFMLV